MRAFLDKVRAKYLAIDLSRERY